MNVKQVIVIVSTVPHISVVLLLSFIVQQTPISQISREGNFLFRNSKNSSWLTWMNNVWWAII